MNTTDIKPFPADAGLPLFEEEAAQYVQPILAGSPGLMRRIAESPSEEALIRFVGMTEELAGRFARDLVAEDYGFRTWQGLTHFMRDMAREASPTRNFELAVDAIVEGDLDTLRWLTGKYTYLIWERSWRAHDATLLHYVAANGVENYRQKTPPNILEITNLLIRAGAAVNAEAEMYGGKSTTLGLTATSMHPRRAGLQIPLMETLLAFGATYDPEGNPSYSCLMNGCPEAAEFFANRGARLDLRSAAGLGRLDVVQGFFDGKGRLMEPATPQQLWEALGLASGYGKNEVVEFLLWHEADLGANGDMSALHYAVHSCHPETVRLLIKYGAPLEEKNRYGGTALGQALWSAVNQDEAGLDYTPVIGMLIGAGAAVRPDMLPWWMEQTPGSGTDKSRVAQLLADAQS